MRKNYSGEFRTINRDEFRRKNNGASYTPAQTLNHKCLLITRMTFYPVIVTFIIGETISCYL